MSECFIQSYPPSVYSYYTDKWFGFLSGMFVGPNYRTDRVESFSTIIHFSTGNMNPVQAISMDKGIILIFIHSFLGVSE